MDPAKMWMKESAPWTVRSDTDIGQAELFSMEIQTCIITAEGVEIHIVNVSNVLSFRCICLECGQNFRTEVSLRLHMETHSNLDCIADVSNDKGKCFGGGDGISHETDDTEVNEELDNHDDDVMEADDDVCGSEGGYSEPDTNIVSADEKKYGGLAVPYTPARSAGDDLQTSSNPCTNGTNMLLRSRERPDKKTNVPDCSVCGEKFNSRKSFLKHMVVHPGVKPYMCQLCGKSYTTSKSHRLHSRLHKGEDLHSCQECGKQFAEQSRLKEHSTVHTGVKPHQCAVCGKQFRLRGQVTQHMRRHTGEKRHMCGICFQSFTDSSNLRQHAAKHEASSVLCSLCGKSFKYRRHLNRHMLTVHGDEYFFTCEFCGKEFKTRSSFNEHCLRHTGERPHTCSVCGKCFYVKYELFQHLRTHTGEKPYSCSQCDKKFNQKYYFEEHMRKHTGEKPFECAECGMAFRMRAALRRHLKKEHQE